MINHVRTLVVDGGEDGPWVDVTASISLPKSGVPNRVGLIANPARSRGWVELTPTQARAVAAALEQAAYETERSA